MLIQKIKKHKSEGYNLTSVIGRSGIEATYEKQLRGEVGLEKLIIG